MGSSFLPFSSSFSSVGKQSQLLLQPTEVELGLQVGVEFDKNISGLSYLKLNLQNKNHGTIVNVTFDHTKYVQGTN